MKTNVIKAILNLIHLPPSSIQNNYSGRNKVNNEGKGLEEFIIDLFCGTVNEIDQLKRVEKKAELFSYIGNQSNPPDAMIREGDAIEIKKIETSNAALALNSSYPMAKLHYDCPMLNNACISCENWIEKDMIYAIGELKKDQNEENKETKSLISLCFVYGVDYAASLDIYNKIKSKIKDGISTINGIEFSETKELGRVNKVDPLGITNLRIRGMWHIDNPFKVFNYIYQPKKNALFNMMTLINIEKYLTFSDEDRNELEKTAKEFKNLVIKDVKIKTPDNPAKLKDAKLITFFLE